MNRRLMTSGERRMAEALSCCTFLPGSWDKRFARSMRGDAAHGESARISEPQAACLRKMVVRYRRQLTLDVIALADEPSPGDPQPVITPGSQQTGLPL